jgi:hypothetical protein
MPAGGEGREAIVFNPVGELLAAEGHASFYAAILAEQFRQPPVMGSDLERQGAYDESYAAALSYGIHSGNQMLVDAAFGALRQPAHVWQAASWAARHQCTIPEGWEENLGRAEAACSDDTYQSFVVAIAKLEMGLAVRRQSGRSVQEEVISSSLADITHLLKDPTVFPWPEQQAARLRVARVLRDAGWVGAAADFRDTIDPRMINRPRLKEFNVALKGLRGRVVSIRRWKADPQEPVSPPLRLTFVEPREWWVDLTPAQVAKDHPWLGRVDIVRNDVKNNVDMVAELEILLRLREHARARRCFEAIFQGEYLISGASASNKPQAAALMEVYDSGRYDEADASRITAQLELLSSPVTSPHSTSPERSIARTEIRRVLSDSLEDSERIVDTRLRARLLLGMLTYADETFGAGDRLTQDLRLRAQRSWTTWRIMTPHDPDLVETSVGAAGNGIKVGCRTFSECGGPTCNDLCTAQARMAGLGLTAIKPLTEGLI